MYHNKTYDDTITDVSRLSSMALHALSGYRYYFVSKDDLVNMAGIRSNIQSIMEEEINTQSSNATRYIEAA